MAYEYDPHLLYQAINITVELQYNVPLKVVYQMIEENEKKEEKLSFNELVSLIKSLSKSFQNKIFSKEDSSSEETLDLKTKIKLMLELLHCELSNDELNKIIKGELSLDEALNQQARIAWKLFFSKDKDGKVRPNQSLVDHMMTLMQDYALLDINEKYKRELLNQTKNRIREIENGDYISNGNIKSERTKKELNVVSQDEKLILLDKQRKKLKLYIAHMQGYDRDRDHDGGRGVNMETGEIIDLEDIYMADKGVNEYLEKDNKNSTIRYERDFSSKF